MQDLVKEKKYKIEGCVTTFFLFHTCAKNEPVGRVSYQR
jgi:hypothetical protein